MHMTSCEARFWPPAWPADRAGAAFNTTLTHTDRQTDRCAARHTHSRTHTPGAPTHRDHLQMKYPFRFKVYAGVRCWRLPSAASRGGCSPLLPVLSTDVLLLMRLTHDSLCESEPRRRRSVLR